MAAALLGVPLRPFNDFVEKRRIQEGKEVRTVEWYLEQSDEKKEFKTTELLKWWRDPAWVAANPKHPLARFREYWNALKDACAHENQAVPIAVKVRELGGGRKRAVFIPFDITPERKKELLEMFNA